MKLNELKARAAELAAKLPYQEYADSPGVKHYIDWSKYEGYTADAPRLSASPAPCEVSVVNGTLAGVGSCGGVEAWASDEAPLRYITIENKMQALIFSKVLEAVHVKLWGRPNAPVVIRASASGQRAFSAAYLYLDVESGFEGDVVILAESFGDVLNAVIVEGTVGDGSSLNLSTVSISAGGPHYVLVRTSVGSRTSVVARPLAYSGSMNSVIEEYVVQGERSSVDVVGLDVGAGDSKIHHYVASVNDGEYGRSRIRLIAISRDRAWVIQRALGRITKQGRWSESVAEGVSYIASPEAVAVTQPVLYIDTGDVLGAKHSAADASLDDEKVFYLRSRGFSPGELPSLVMLSLIDQYKSSLPEGLSRALSPYLAKIET